jgi:hypothetical protein
MSESQKMALDIMMIAMNNSGNETLMRQMLAAAEGLHLAP